ncbi:unnamed protein product [Albugo candida]|uniref:DNA mismatch repair proteins mutS family domain-containing protein n=1 Tax=Albugo candida TaxID=65357 RepID=A0A024GPP8_9STRA|nr:unnamed protein product [Albugo candida]|eukprot:CCI48498.1 unnamed protein product [Albugo candida]
MLRSWMLAPLTDPNEINHRLDTVQFFSDQSNEATRANLVDQLKRFRDISAIFLKIRQRSASARDWCNLYRSIISFMSSRSYIQEIVQSWDSSTILLFQQFSDETGGSQISNLLGNIIDVEESSASDSIVIHEGVSEQLDDARIQYNHLDNVLSEVAYQICERSPSLRGITVQYIPQVGYVICCDSPTVLPDFVFQFQEDDNTFYYKVDECCRDLDESIGDIFGHIQDMQRGNLPVLALLEQLTITLIPHECSIHKMCELMGFLDVYMALAECARNSSFIRPRVHEEISISVKQARHPLQELVVEQFIPNDITLVDGRKTMLVNIITGHNGSGKSVYLKTVGLIQYMVQIGSFVPAKEASVGVVSGIFTRIQSLETANLSQSSFTIDCSQLARMLHQCDRQSLLLVDEFGKGTSELDGLSLLSSTINHLTSRVSKDGGPRVLITTHQLKIMAQKLVSYGNEDGFSQETKESAPMFTLLTSDDRTNAPLYTLQLGIAEGSNAIGCATNSGITDEIILRAREILELMRQEAHIPPQSVSVTRYMQFCQQLSSTFDSVSNWIEASDEEVDKLILTARLID